MDIGPLPLADNRKLGGTSADDSTVGNSIKNIRTHLVDEIIDDLGEEHGHQNPHHDKQDGADGQDSFTDEKIEKIYHLSNDSHFSLIK